MVCGQPSGIKSVEFQNGLCPSTNQMTCGRARAKNTKMMQNRRVINTQCRGEHTNVRETTTYYDSIQLADFRKMLLYAVWLFFKVLFILMVVESTFFFFTRGGLPKLLGSVARTQLNQHCQKKSEAPIRTRLTQTCAILASDFCWQVFMGSSFSFKTSWCCSCHFLQE